MPLLCSKFALENSEKPYINFCVMILHDLSTATYHKENMKVISTEDVQIINQATFDINNTKNLTQTYQNFQKTKSYYNLKESIISEGKKTLNSWGKTNFENFIDL